ncbi:hypothetical protein [Jiangella alkaliphila]|uniref:Uncharacterized protein n=1 Tax=Jiangella alkaliphila TaxID=419479 RepID=A0A1H2L6X3_9ACTN|nr:hypothetical protein [Jiangella alkaliphila]SDU76817.1 hypothetical protein SAMN04488563_5325 [Jiangella alkaliphila]
MAARSILVLGDQVIATSPTAAVSILQVRAFSQGCLMSVSAIARRSDRVAWYPRNWFRTGNSASGTLAPDDLLRFTVSLTDGRQASSLDPWRRPADTPDPDLSLTTYGTRVRSSTADPYGAPSDPAGADTVVAEITTELWLWPRPDTAGLTLTVSWPAFGITAVPAPIDARHIHDTATAAGIW